MVIQHRLSEKRANKAQLALETLMSGEIAVTRMYKALDALTLDNLSIQGVSGLHSDIGGCSFLGLKAFRP